MKVARKKPEVVKAPVYVTADKYEIWYGNPRSLGTIDNRGGYWYTADGMRFMSSRDAMEYLIRIFELSHKTTSPAVTIPDVVRKEAAAKVVASKKKIVKRAGASSLAAQPKPAPSPVVTGDAAIMKEILNVFRRHPELLRESSKE